MAEKLEELWAIGQKSRAQLKKGVGEEFKKKKEENYWEDREKKNSRHTEVRGITNKKKE